MLFTFDLETSVDCKEDGRMSATPHFGENKIVLAGWKAGDFPAMIPNEDIVSSLIDSMEAHLSMRKVLVLCGFNIGFDLAYLLREKKFLKLLNDYSHKIRVWDVQQAEYLISGQQWKYPSLDDACRRYGLPTKPDKIKEYWKAGMRTEDIEREELITYLFHDINVTEILARRQAKDMPQRLKELCFMKGDDIMCTTIMENVGMNFDMNKCAEISHELRVALMKVEQNLADLVRSESGYEFFASTKLRDVQTVLYGGTFVWDTREQDGVYKTGLKKGQPRMKKVEKYINFDGILSPKTRKEARERFGTAVSDSVLKWIIENEHPENWAVGQFIGYLQNFREWHKDLSTYYDGYGKLVWADGRIRPSFQHCSTSTGRLSCTQPNLQNVSKGE